MLDLERMQTQTLYPQQTVTHTNVRSVQGARMCCGRLDWTAHRTVAALPWDFLGQFHGHQCPVRNEASISWAPVPGEKRGVNFMGTNFMGPVRNEGSNSRLGEEHIDGGGLVGSDCMFAASWGSSILVSVEPLITPTSHPCHSGLRFCVGNGGSRRRGTPALEHARFPYLWASHVGAASFLDDHSV